MYITDLSTLKNITLIVHRLNKDDNNLSSEQVLEQNFSKKVKFYKRCFHKVVLVGFPLEFTFSCTMTNKLRIG